MTGATPPAGEPRKGEPRLREMTAEQSAEALARAAEFQEFKRLAKLPENLRKSNDEIWKLVRAA
jgi:hypothetical protein